MQSASILASSPLFEGVNAEDLSAMTACLGARTAAYQKNTVILSEGAPSGEIGVVLSGRVQIVRTDFYGNRSIMMTISPGELFGEAFACAEVAILPVSIVAAEDSTVMMINCRRIMKTCSNACEFHSRLIFNLLKIVSMKNLALHRKAEITSRRTTREKILTYLLQQAKLSGSSRFTIPFDRQALADYLEVDRSGLSAELGKLKKQGVLDFHKNSFHLIKTLQ